MTEELVLDVRDLGKRFKIYSNPWHRVQEWLSPWGRLLHRPFWAVQDVTFTVRKGEFLGIIGPNGAGKSTLLKMITGVLAPTRGDYQLHGRILSLLELGTGMDLELTGRENVRRSAQLLELPEGYVEQRMEQIYEFSELGEFFDRPMSMYSTGMRTRLSFSMFAFIDCDVLILDEVLAVGDIFFKQKCFARLDELIKRNTSIILVTHSMGIIQRYCSRVILMNEGRVVLDGDPVDAIRQFTLLRGRAKAREVAPVVAQELVEGGLSEEKAAKLMSSFEVSEQHRLEWPADDLFQASDKTGAGAVLRRFAVLNSAGDPSLAFRQGETVSMYFEFLLRQPCQIPVVQIEVRDEFNLLVHGKRSLKQEMRLPSNIPAGILLRCIYDLKLDLAPQAYLLNLDLFSLAPQKKGKLSVTLYAEAVRELDRLIHIDRVVAVQVLPGPGGSLDEKAFGGLVGLQGEFETGLELKS